MANRAKKPGARRPFKLSRAEVELLRGFALERPSDTLMELAERFTQRTGKAIHDETVGKALARAGVVRVKPSRVERESDRDPHRFTERHRVRGPEGGYPTSLTDAEWALVSDIFDRRGPGRPPKHPRRLVLDACVYVVRSGCSWRMLPKDFPKWEDVYAHFQRWTRKGLFEEMNARLAGMWRERAGKSVEPTAAILDSQSVRTSPQGGPRGIDANKKIVGRKRHLVTDTLGLLLAVVVTAASVQDRDAAEPAVKAARVRAAKVTTLFVDSAYQGSCAKNLRKSGLDVQVIRRPDRYGIWTTKQLALPTMAKGFNVQPKRWVIERTNAWISSVRRLARDYDRKTSTSVAWVWLVQGRQLLSRLVAA